jgi:hypothetical protein
MMRDKGRRRFMAGVGSTALALRAGGRAEAQAPPRGAPSDAEGRHRRVAAAIRELNQSAGLGVAQEDLEGAEAYAVGALLEAEAKLRPLRLDPSLDVAVVFRAGKRS